MNVWPNLKNKTKQNKEKLQKNMDTTSYNIAQEFIQHFQTIKCMMLHLHVELAYRGFYKHGFVTTT